MDSIWLTGAQWLAVLRIGLGLWWLESWRHKDRKAWFERGTGIAWADSAVLAHTYLLIDGEVEFLQDLPVSGVIGKPFDRRALIAEAKDCIGH